MSQVIRLRLGDCIEVLRAMETGSVDAFVTDPPYGLSFMNKAWDSGLEQSWHEEWLAECFRVLVLGGIIEAFSGTRTQHRLAAAMEAVGFELVPEESLQAWAYGSGFPKSLNISKALDRQAGAEREMVLGPKPGHEGFVDRTTKGHITSLANEVMGQEGGFARPWMQDEGGRRGYHLLTAPVTDDAKRFESYGTSLKPAWEPVLIGRKI